MDLDYTLLFGPRPWTEAGVPAMRPNEPLVRWLQARMRVGDRVVVVTGRPDWLTSITRRQVELLLGPDAGVVMANGPTPSEMAKRKANALRTCGASLFIGDSRWDRRAAALAGLAYCDAFEIQPGRLLDGRS